MRRLAVGVALVAVLSGVPAASSPALEFGPRVFVTDGRGEPSLALGPDGALYVSTLGDRRDIVAKSADGGATWRDLGGTNQPFGGADDHVVVAPDNTVYLAGQWNGNLCISVARGEGGGRSWTTNPVACATPSIDRPWLAVSGRGPLGTRLYLNYTDPCCIGRQLVTRSDDGGLTWLPLAYLAGGFPGYILADDASGFVYVATTRRAAGTELVVYRSSDDLTWTAHVAARFVSPAGDHGLNHVFLAHDAAGSLYTAWAEDRDGTGMHVWLTSSADHGDTWTPPAKVSSSPGTHVFPTVAAGAGGRVAVAWYATSDAAAPREVSPGARWFPVAASTWDGGATWASAPVARVPNHFGPLCSAGAACPPAERGLLDFFMAQVDAEQRVNVAWADDTNGRKVYFARSRA